MTLTTALEDAGYEQQGETPGGRHHRWVRGAASIDVLIPEGLGERSALRPGAHSITSDRGRTRHLDDLALLVSMLRGSDLRDLALSRSERRYLRPALTALRELPKLGDFPGSVQGLQRLERLLS